MDSQKNNYRPFIWYGILGALLAIVNNIIATIGLGVFQGPFVAFTTPFIFALSKFIFPKKMGATFVFIPVIFVSIFTFNFGPPGFYKVVFICGALFYDIICYLLFFHRQKSPNFKIWKLIVAVVFYPIGLLLGAIIAIKWIITDIEIPIISQGIIGAILMVVLFAVIGTFSTIVSFKLYKKFLYHELEEYSDET